MKELTQRQKEVFDQIIAYKAQYDTEPSVRWLAKAFNMTTSGMAGHVSALIRKNYLAWDIENSKARIR